ncbi:MAG: hypothetical protein KFKLKKLM_00708 [Flavobacteriales bacterium]|nr:hypothetical protein [Flavobacteriales bacterium]
MLCVLIKARINPIKGLFWLGRYRVKSWFWLGYYRKCGFKFVYSRNKWLYVFYIQFFWFEFGCSSLSL